MISVTDLSADIDIVIVNWNAGYMLRDCVQTVLDTAEELVGNIIIVDNGSNDHSLRHLPCDPRIRTVRAGENLGFARACNLGASKLSGRFILFLNPDTRLHPRALVNVRSFMDSATGKTVGVCGIQLRCDDGAIQLHTTEFPGPLDIYQVSLFRTRFDHRTDRVVSHVIGAFYFIRRDLFVRLSGFDERFFLYFEDLDLSLRVKRSGWLVYYLASAQAYHKGGGTSDGIKARRLFYSQSSRLEYARKHFSFAGFIIVVMTTFLIEPVLRFIRALLNRSWAQARETLGAYRLLLEKYSPFRSRTRR